MSTSVRPTTGGRTSRYLSLVTTAIFLFGLMASPVAAASAPPSAPVQAVNASSGSTVPSATPEAAAPATSFAAGSLIIPMDTDTTGNHTAYNQNLGMWKAYGLLYKLLQNGIPVSWAIKEAKTTTSTVDFTVSNVTDKSTSTGLGSWSYTGGPFIIDSANAAAASPIIAAWLAANGNRPNVHEAVDGFNADVNVVLRSAPRIANEAINAGITMAYYNAAGIPDANGKPWTSTSPGILTEAQIAAGGLFLQGTVCLQRKYDVFVTPHNSGYSYSLSDPTNLGTKTYSQLDTFVHQGGGWTALCHSILSNENFIRDLTVNGSAAVKALFKTSLPGGQPGGFLTYSGFTTIDNTSGSWMINTTAADLPTAQLVQTAVAQALPGGSVQTWPAPPATGAPAYYASTERVGYFDTAGVDHDNIIAGVYHNGTGAGKLTYIGGHSFSTTVPYSGNFEAPYLRAFYNSLFFNGSAVAKVDLTFSPSTFPQGGTGLLTANIANTGASVATNVDNASVTLSPGFAFVASTFGPAPTVTGVPETGQTLTWGSSLGSINGGTTAASFTVSVPSSVSDTAGVKQFGQFHATYGDVFGEGFTADVCRDLTISPVPGPALTKTPASQGPVTAGSSVTWTLTYGNTGASDLFTPVLQDTLPAGFSYVSSSSSPTIGAPTVIPAVSGTILRWNLSTLLANTAATRTVTITARAAAVTNGTGDPLQQTFTNNATLTGKDSGGTTYSAVASATVVVRALDISLGKSVNKTFLSTLPGSVTYTLTPRSSGNDLLDNVRVIDPVPTGVTSPVAGQGGTVGSYTPIAAVGGVDGNLTTAMTVSTNLVNQGGSVTVTLNVKNNAIVNNVSPSDLDVSGGDATCTGPVPASGDVPAGGSGLNFVWTCTLADLGEYIFSADAADAGATVAWPPASSASVLSIAGGGPNVVTWNLGSTTAAVPGETLTGGYTDGVYGLRGATTTTFQKYGISGNAWSAKAGAPAAIAKGGALTTDGAGTIYALRGNKQKDFYAYDIATDVWTAKTNTGTNVDEGGAAVFLNVSGTKYVFALMGNSNVFKRYDVAANTWSAMTNTPATVKKGGALTTDGTNIYATGGNNSTAFWRYNVAANTWTTLAVVPSKVGWGGSLVRLGGYLYAFTGDAGAGSNKKLFYRYDIAGDSWTAMANAPGDVKAGGALTTDGTNLYAFQGKTTAFWRYNVGLNTWTTLTAFAAATDQGGALVYAPGLNATGRFTSLSASRSLVVSGDTVTVTFTITSTAAVNTVTASALTVTPTNGASCGTLTGPTLTSADDDIADINDPVVFEWTCIVAAGTNPGSLKFSASATGSGPVAFPAATSNSVLVSPPLTFTATVPIGAPNPVIDSALVIASGETASSPTVSTFSGQPNLTVTKSNSPGEGTTVLPGDPITYTLVVENSGTGTATNVVVTDPVPTNTTYVTCSGGTSCSQSLGTVTWTIDTLAPGSTTISFTVAASTSVAISATPYTISNTASVDSDQTDPTPSNTVTNHLQVLPTIVKSVDLAEAAPGDTLVYTLEISNPGAAFTADVTDAVPTGASFADGCSPACTFADPTVTWAGVTINPGTNTFTFEVTVTASGGATITNIGTLDPTSPNLDPIPSNPVETKIGPSLEIVKFNDPTGPLAAGASITYKLLISNESDVTATSVVVSDVVPSALDYVSCSGGDSCGLSAGVVTWTFASIGAASETVSFTATVKNPVPAGVTQIDNYGQVSASNQPEATVSNTVSNPIAGLGDLILVKTASPTIYSAVDQVITYSYKLQNVGPVKLTAPFAVDDDKTSDESCPSDASGVGNNDAFLDPGETLTCTSSYTITQDDLNDGFVTNLATGTAKDSVDPFPTVTSNEGTATVTATQGPALTIAKSITSGSPYTAAGQTVHYSYLITNSGNVTLNGPFSVTDNKTTVDCTGAPGSLAPLATTTCTATYLVTQADVDTGSVVNIAAAHGYFGTTEVISPTDTKTATAVQTPSISITKHASLDMTVVAPDTRADAGDKIDYTFDVTNTGNVTLTSVTVTDPLTGLNCTTIGTLLPSATVIATCPTSYTLLQTDIDAGSRANTATVSGTPPSGSAVTGTDSATVPLAQTPALTFVKTISAGDPYSVDGGTISYSYTVTNTGNVTVSGIVVTDDNVDASPVCDVTTLDPGQTATCTAVHTVTLADLNAGTVTNHAYATGTDTNGDPVLSNPDSQTAHAAQTPALTFVKTISAGDPYSVDGGTISYSYTVTNTGNVTVSGIVVTDDNVDASPVCDVTTLDPGQTATCTAVHTVTLADLNAGTVTNHAYATGTDTNGDPVLSNPDSQTAHAAQTPALTFVKTISAGDPYSVDGGTISYSYTVTNTGNVTVSGIVVTDDNVDASPVCDVTTLDPGQTATCTAVHTVTLADLNAGTVTNHAYATGTDTNGDPVLSNPDSQTAHAAQTPALTFVKTISAGDPYSVDGGTISYSYTVTNTGNVTVSGIVVTDDNVDASPVCDVTTLDPGQTATCTAVHTVTLADLNAGTVTNHAYATGTDTNGDPVLSNPDSQTAHAAQTPALTFVKTISAGDPYSVDGGTISYSYTVTNTGNVTVSGIVVTDDNVDASPVCDVTTLDPGQTATCTAVHTVTLADLNAGTVTNHAYATGTDTNGDPVLSNPDSQTAHAAQTPALTFVKTISAGDPYSVDGGTISYSYTVTNTGNVTVSGIVVTDDNVDASPVCDVTTLDPGQTATCTAVHTVTLADLNAGTVTNHAYATGTDTNGDPVLSNPDSQTAHAAQTPALTFVKTISAGDPYSVDGGTISYSYTVTNTGNVTVSGIVVTDDNVDASPVCDVTTLDPGQTATCTAVHTVTLADLNAGTVTNHAYATGTDTNGDPVLSNPDSQTAHAAQTPALTFVKTISAGDPYSVDGGTISYSYTVTNTGNVTVSGIVVTDDNVDASPVCDVTTLDPGQTATCTAVHTVTLADLNAGTVTNHAYATGTDTNGDPVLSNPDSQTAHAAQTPALTFVKTISAGDPYSVDGGTISYSYTVTNTGNVTVSGIVVTDDNVDASPVCDVTTLDPGQTATCTAVHTVTLADLNAGTVTNHAYATGTDTNGDPVLSNPDSQTAHAAQTPALTFVKTISAGDPYSVDGGTISYSYTVTNTGNVTVSGIVVTDDNVDASPVCDVTTLDPGQTATCTAVHTVTLADLNAGTVTNHAYATGTDTNGDPVLSNPDSQTAHAAQTPALTFVKTISAGDPYSVDGGTISYSYTVTNTGNVTVSGIVVTDDNVDASPVCDVTTLDPGQTATCTAVHTVTLADLNAGTVTNHAYATGTDTNGDPVLSNPDSQTAHAAQTPALTFVKTISAGDPYSVDGGTISYSYTVTNTGNVTVSGIVVTDDNVDASPVCDVTTLDPGQTATCTAVHTVTLADLNAGTVTNHAYATGTDTNGDPVLSNPDSQTAHAAQTPALTFVKTISAGDPYSVDGGTISYSYTVTNTGNVTVSGIVVTDDNVDASPVCDVTTLDPGQTATCTAVHTVTLADLNAGTVTNHAYATGTDTNGDPVLSNPDSQTAHAAQTPALTFVKTISAGDPYSVDGGTISYSYTVTNTGNVTVSGIVVTDDNVDASPVCDVTTLDPGQTATCTAVHTVTLADLNAGTVTNHAYATGTDTNGDPVLSNPDSQTAHAAQTPALTFVKTISAGDPYSVDGGTISYSYTVTNTGNVTVSGIVVTDDNVDASPVCDVTTLDPGQTATCTAVHTVTLADLNAGTVTNHAYATGTDTNGDPVLSNPDSQTAHAAQTPALTFVKTISAGDPYSVDGGTISYSYTVTNTGNVTVSGIVVTDDNVDASPVCDVTTLDPGQTATCTAVHTVTLADLNAGTVTNHAYATGTDTNGDPVLSNPDSQTAHAAQTPALTFVKTISAGDPYSVDGGTISYSYTVTNTGNVTVSGIVVTDDNVDASPVCDVTTLDPGQTATCTAVHTVTLADLNAGTVTNHAYATGTDTNGDPVLSNPDSQTAHAAQTPALTFVKTISAGDPYSVDGGTISYSYTVTNTGNVTVSGIVVTDDNVDASPVCDVTTLDPGQTATCTAVHTVTLADLNAGTVTNHAYATGTDTNGDPVLSNPDSQTAHAAQTPALTFVKTISAGDPYSVDGGTISYSYTVTNTGNVTVSGIVVTDDNVDASPVCDVTTLDPGQTATCTAVHTVTLADLNAGTVTNHAYATGTDTNGDPVLSNPDSQTAHAAQTPALTFVKTISAGDPYSVDGGTISYSYTVTNTGNVTVSGIVVTDDNVDASPVCDVTTLDPGQTATCTAVHTVTLADLNAGTVTNHAYATGTDTNGDPVLSNPDSQTAHAAQTPALTFVKTISAGDPYSVDGGTISYSYTVTNTGNVTVSGIVVTDDNVDASPVCDVTTLDPGQTATCTAVHTVTLADLNAGTVTNHAYATGTDTNGDPVLSNPDSQTAHAAQTPALTFVKTISAGDPYSVDGGTISYSYTVTNTGNVTVSGIVVTDDNVDASPVCDVTTLDPGQTATCTAVHTVTLADLNAGTVTNHAYATGTDTNGDPVLSNPDSQTAHAAQTPALTFVKTISAGDPYSVDGGTISYSYTVTNTGNVTVSGIVVTDDNVDASPVCDVTTLDPGQTATCTAVHTVTLADLNAGTVTNHAYATGTDTNGDPVLSNPDSQTAHAAQTPALTFVKTISAGDPYSVDGGTISYSYTVTNTGNVTVSGIVVTDDNVDASPVCDVTTLDPGQTATCTAVHTVTLADLNAGTVTNHAYATGTDTNGDPVLSNPDSQTAHAAQTPALTFVKTISAGDPYSVDGGTISYSYTVTNTGNVTVSGIVVTDDNVDASPVCDVTTLDPGQTATCTAVHTVTLADLNAGTVTNHAYATGTDTNGDPVLSNPDSQTAHAAQTPALTFVKTISAGDPYSVDGGTISYSYTVTNTGNVTVSGIVVTDDNVDASPVCDVTTLDPGQTATCTAVHTVTLADLNAGTVTNHAYATGTDTNGDPVLSNPDSQTAHAAQTPALTFVKTISAGDPYSVDGGTISYSYTVTNTGNVTVSGIVVTDDNVDASPVCDVTTLDPGQTATCTAVHTVTLADLNAGTVTNHAYATGTDTNGDPVLSNPDSQTAHAAQTPALTFVKTISAGDPYSVDGGTISYSYTVTNTGNVTVSGIVVTDDNVDASPVCDVTTLDPGQTATCTAVHTVTLADLNAGTVTNHAYATGTDTNGDPVLSNPDSQTAHAAQTPALTFVKTISAGDPYSVDGGTISYSYTVTNTGNVTVSGIVVTDDNVDASPVCDVTTLDPGQTATCTAVHTVTLADLNAGTVTNHAYATGTDTNGDPVLSNPDSQTAHAAQTPALTFVKTISAGDPYSVDGGTISYSYTVTNTGNVTVSGIVVTDDNVDASPVCDVTTLDPGQTATCTAVHTVTLADLNAGTVTNHAYATGTDTNGDPVLSNPDSQTAHAAQTPALTFVKTISAGDPYSVDGGTISYSYTVTNTGNVTVSGIVVTDDNVDASPVCDVTTLDPGQTATCTAVHTVTLADLNAGTVTNHAYATGTDTNGDPVLSNPDSQTAHAAQTPALTFVKTISAGDPYSVDGGTISYSYTVTNTGNVTVSGIVVTDDNVDASPVCDVTTLDPGQTATCTAVHTVTLADLNAGTVTNHAYATGTDTNGDPVLSNPDSQTAHAAQTPALTFVKTISAGDPYSVDGGTISYSYTVTNTGNVTVSGIVVTDDNVDASPVCDVTTLDPGQTATCTAVHTVTLADLNAGTVTNHAYATGTDTNGDPVLSNPDSQTAHAAQTPALTFVKTISAGDPYSVDGGTISYSYTVTNTGNVTVSGIVVTDDNVDASPVCDVTTLDPGQTATCTAVHTVTLADLNAGTVTNHAYATGTDTNGDPVLSNPDSQTAHAAQTPALTFVKTISAGDPYSVDGGTISYSYTVTNTGNVTVSGIVVTDDNVDASPVCDVTTLDPGQTATCTAVHTVTLADLNAGTVTNHAYATGTDTNGDPVLSNPDSQTAHAAQTPALTFVKTISAGDPYSVDGGTISYSYTVTNTGNVTVSGIVVTDDNVDASPVCDVTTLDPGQTATCTAVHTVTLADLNAGTVTNHAYATGTDTNGDPVLSNPDSQTAHAAQTPALTFVKTISAGDPYSVDGGTISYSYTVTNTGNVTVSGIVVTDDNVDASPVCDVTTLDPGQTATCTAVHTVTLADLNAGTVTNHAYATGTDTNGDPVLSNPDSQTAHAAQTPALTFVKTISAGDPYSVDGGTISYSYTVTNTGNVTVSGIVVTDDNVDASPVCDVTTLDPGQTATCTAVHTVTLADLNAGTVTNHAYATGTDTNGDPVLSNPDSQTAHAAQTPALTFVKTISAGDPYSVDGGTISYSYTVTNTGNVTVSGIVVTDDNVDASPVCDVTTLDPGQTATCTAVHTVTLADLNAGTVTNHAYATGTDTNGDPVLSNPDSQTAHAAQTPALTFVKTISAGDPYSVDGGTISYSYTVTNTGNVTVSGIVVTDDNVDASPVCDVTTLDPGQTATCTAVHTVTLADLNAGTVTNHAYATGTDTNGDPVLSNPDSQTAHAAQTPALTFVKTISAGDPYSVDGGTISYSYTVTNTGNVTVSGIVVTDDNVDASPVCDVTTLDPGQTATCTAVHTVTLADLNAGTVTNHAYATGTDTNGDPVLSNPDSQTAHAAQTPALTFVKTGTLDMAVVAPSNRADVGDVIHYTITATNTGNVTLTGVTVVDLKLGTLVCTPVQPATLLPGQSISCSADYVLTQADLNLGRVDNLATADSDQTTPTDATQTVPLGQAPALSLTKTPTPTTYSAAGNVINYSYVVENTGNVRLAGPVTVSDDKSTDETCPDVNTVGNHDGFLDPGEQITCSATYLITAADLSNGSVTNHATASAAGTPSNEATATVTAVNLTPGMTLEKTADKATIEPYESVTYSYKVTNTGGTTLHNIVVTDDNGTPLFAGDDFIVDTIPTLGPGDSVTLTATVIPVVSTVGSVNGNQVPAGAVIVVETLGSGDIKVTYLQDFGINDNTYGTGAIGWPSTHKFNDLVGSDKLEFRFFDADGNVVLDFYQDTISASTAFPSGYGSLCASGGDGSMVFGSVSNIVSCTTSITTNLNNPLNVPNKAALIVNSPTSLVSGDVVVNMTQAPGGWDYINSYTVIVKASTFGEAGFGGVAVPDQHNSPNKLGGPNGMATTPVSSTVTNTATATASDGTTDTDTATVDIVVPPSSLSGFTYVDANNNGIKESGEAGIQNVSVKLTGTTVLGAVVSITTTTDADGYYIFPNLMAGTYAITQTQPAAYTDGKDTIGTPGGTTGNNTFTNIVLPAGFEGVDNNFGELLAPVGALQVVKTSTTTEITAAGQVVPYTFTVTNSSTKNQTKLKVTDPKCTTAISRLSGDTNGDGKLQPTETWVYTCTHTVTQAEMDAGGNLSNTVTVDSTESTPATATYVIPVTQSPAVSLVKKTNGTDNDTAPGPDVPIGSTVTWTYAVTNTGNVTLTALTVTDNPEGSVCTIASLAPGKSSTCTKTGIAVAGPYENTGTVTGTSPAGAPVPASNMDHYNGVVAPNQPPKAVNETYSTKKNIVLNVAAPGVLANDTDPENNALTAVLVTNVTKGTLVLNPDGSFTYTPATNFTGKITFTYKANDGIADSNVATVTINVMK